MENGELSSYQSMIQRNIEENKRVLQSLGFSFRTSYQPKEKLARPSSARKSVSKPKGRQSIAQVDFRPTRIHTRRSSCLLETSGLDDSAISPEINNDEENTPPKKKTRSEPVFGEIEGVSVGDWWPSRLDCSAAGVHRPTVAGIHGKQGEGCYSIALSGGYEDDVDCGTYFTYTGCGGRDLKGTKCNPKNLRTAPQSKDQVFEGLNAALASNVESRKPVRVIRGFKLQSDFAPEEGYRFDGLYSVEKYWTATGLSGFKVYKFALKRLVDQDPPPWEGCIKSEPFSSEEVKIIPAHLDKMDTTKSLSTFKSSPSKLSSRGRPRKQTSPKQHCQNEENESISIEEWVEDFLIEFDKGFENDSKDHKVPLTEETLKATENIIHNTKNNNDSFPMKDHLDVNTTPPKGRSFKDHKLEPEVKSTEKKVRFSHLVEYKIEIDKEDIQSQASNDEEKREPCNGDLQINNSDGKKQTTILKYFSPVKQNFENLPSKTTINPKSLRSNRFTNISISSSNDTPKYFHGFNSNICSPSTSKSCTENGHTNSDKKLICSPKNTNRSSSHKRKYSSSYTKHKEFDLDLHTLYEKSPSMTMMENLIKQNNEKRKLHKRIATKKRINYPDNRVKPCSVVLKRIQDLNHSDSVFLGWDSEKDRFLGFSETDFKRIKKTHDKLTETINNSCYKTEKDTPQKLNLGFHGWNVNKDDFQGSSGLVPIGFIIDKLSKS